MPRNTKRKRDKELLSDSESEIEVVKTSRISDVTNKEQKKKGKRIKNSNFVFTINTNRQLGADDEELLPFCRKLKDVIDKNIFDKIEEHIVFLEPGHSWEKRYVKKAECDSNVERGDKFDQVHAHLFVGVSHYSKIRLNTSSIRQVLMKKLDLSGVYISKPKVLRGSTAGDLQRWLEYSRKNLKEKKARIQKYKEEEEEEEDADE